MPPRVLLSAQQQQKGWASYCLLLQACLLALLLLSLMTCPLLLQCQAWLQLLPTQMAVLPRVLLLRDHWHLPSGLACCSLLPLHLRHPDPLPAVVAPP